MKKLLSLLAFFILFSIAGFGQNREQIIKIPKGKYSVKISGITSEKKPVTYVIPALKAGQTIRIRVVPKNLVIGLLVEYVEARSGIGSITYKVGAGQNGFNFQFDIGNGRSGTKYTAVIEIR